MLSPVGASLLANAVDQLHHLWLAHCFREQARSHRETVCDALYHRESATRALCGRLCRFARWAFMTRCFGTGVLSVSFVRLQEFSCV
jgi:hypothetical protein